MAVRPILFIPDRRLKTVAEPVSEITNEIRQQVKDMFDTMYDAPGIGLAAPQIGVMNRVVVVDCAKRAEELGEDGLVATGGETEQASETPDPIAMINPEIVWFSHEMRVHEEGCLSIPDYYELVERPDRIRIRYLTVEGDIVEREADGILSTCMQHEVDHLDGKLFIDYLSRLKRERITKKFEKLAKRAAS